MIAGLAATEVDGVGAMVGNITNELMGRVGRAEGRHEKTDKRRED